MDSYADRIGKFNDMIQDTADHVEAVRDAATKWDNSDPVGSALTITGAAAGGVGGLAGSVAAIQHFKDFKTMYKNVANRLGKARTDGVSGRGGGDQGGGDANNRPSANSNDASGQSRGNAGADNDGQAPKPQSDGTGTQNPAQGNAGSGGADVDGGLADRIDNMNTTPFPTQEANSINKAIEAKASANGIDKADLNARLATSGRSTKELQSLKQLPEGNLKADSQQDFLRFKNNVANDAISRQNAGRTPASGYDSNGNPTGDLPGPQPQAAGGDVLRTAANPNATAAPDGNLGGGSLAPDVNAAPVTNASGDIQSAVSGAQADVQAQAGSIVARGRAALSNLMGGQQVPGSQGQAVQGLRVTQNVDNSQAANAASRVQQGLADQTQGARSALAHPNTGGGQPAQPNPNAAAGTDGGSNAPAGGAGGGANPQPNPASTAASSVDDVDAGTTVARAANTASKAAGAISDVADVGDAVDLMAGMAGPAAPIVGLIGGLISLGTTIAGLFHKKPPPKKEAPPPAQAQSIGANLSSTQSMGGAGIY
jgi:hypothetical protein